MNDKAEIKYGLAGVVADKTAISTVMKETNSLTYRGYAVEDLCEHTSFLQTAYLLLYGELPSSEEFRAFKDREASQRGLSSGVMSLLRGFDSGTHPMDTLRTAVSLLGAEDPKTHEGSREAILEKAAALLARIPTCVAADYRLRSGLEPIPPDPELGFSDNFFKMCFGEPPAPEVRKCFEISMILYAEHSFNASTFSARVVTSTLSDVYSSVVAGIGALKGPLHGGANEAVMHMLLEIGEPEKAEAWIRTALTEKRKIMGFGHRVYRSGDTRVPMMTKAFHQMAKLKGGEKWIEISQVLEDVMLKEKGIYPNLDFPTGPAYYLMGFPIPIYTPIFVMSRLVGWAAHILEQSQHNKLIRPLAAYSGVPQRSLNGAAV